MVKRILKEGINLSESLFIEGWMHDQIVAGNYPKYNEPFMTGLPKTSNNSRQTISIWDLATKDKKIKN